METKTLSYDDLLEALKGAETAVKSLYGDFFARYPAVRALAWTQYTPYFDDGEPCVFRCNARYGHAVYLGDAPEEPSAESWAELFHEGHFMGDYETSSYVKESYKQWNAPEMAEAKASLGAMEIKIHKDLYKAAFGDHALVIATPEGFYVTEYDHD